MSKNIITALLYSIGLISFVGNIAILVKEGYRYAVDIQIIFFISGLCGLALTVLAFLK